MNRVEGRGVRFCFRDVYATWPQVAFGAFVVLLLIIVTIDISTNSYSLEATGNILAWLAHQDLLTFVLLFILLGTVAIVLLLPQTVLSLGAGYVCAGRIGDGFLGFFSALCLALVTFILGATVAFLLARRILPPSCTRNFFRHFRILQGLDHALKHRGRRIIILLRINPLSPYNALNYGLGLSSCTLRAYMEGMVGVLPYTCVAVYAGMVISSIEDLDTIFEHTGVIWYSIYALLALAFFLSFLLVVRYTKAEMDAAQAAVSSASTNDRSNQNPVYGGLQRDYEAYEEGGAGSDSTLFGTFTASVRGDQEGVEVEKEMTTFEQGIAARLPLLGDEDSRHGDVPSVEDSVE